MTPLCQKDLKRLMFTDANNIANLVNRMEKAGLISRYGCHKDKRRNLLALSSKRKIFSNEKGRNQNFEWAFAGMSKVKKRETALFLVQVCTKIDITIIFPFYANQLPSLDFNVVCHWHKRRNPIILPQQLEIC